MSTIVAGHQSLLNNCESDEEVHIEEAEKVFLYFCWSTQTATYAMGTDISLSVVRPASVVHAVVLSQKLSKIDP